MSDLHNRYVARRREQRIVLGIGLIVAGLPILCQFLTALALVSDPQCFPHADTQITDARFWPIQIVLLCVAVAGNAAVDAIRLLREGNPLAGPALTFFLLMLLSFIAVSIMFPITLLTTHIHWPWLVLMMGLGLANISLAYLLEMDLATVE